MSTANEKKGSETKPAPAAPATEPRPVTPQSKPEPTSMPGPGEKSKHSIDLPNWHRRR